MRTIPCKTAIAVFFCGILLQVLYTAGCVTGMDTAQPSDSEETICSASEEVWNGLDDDCDGCVDNRPLSFLWDGMGNVTIEVVGGDPSGYSFGFVENAVDGIGWEGESCLMASEGCQHLTAFEELDRAGVTLLVVESEADVELDLSTLLSTSLYAVSTKILWDSAGGCYIYEVEGMDLGYYDALGCCVISSPW